MTFAAKHAFVTVLNWYKVASVLFEPMVYDISFSAALKLHLYRTRAPPPRRECPPLYIGTCPFARINYTPAQKTPILDDAPGPLLCCCKTEIGGVKKQEEKGKRKLQPPSFRSARDEAKKHQTHPLGNISTRVLSRRRLKQPQNPLVHAEHDGGARHRPHQVRRHAAVQPREALLEPHPPEALHQARVLGPAVGHGRLS